MVTIKITGLTEHFSTADYTKDQTGIMFYLDPNRTWQILAISDSGAGSYGGKGSSGVVILQGRYS